MKKLLYILLFCLTACNSSPDTVTTSNTNLPEPIVTEPQSNQSPVNTTSHSISLANNTTYSMADVIDTVYFFLPTTRLVGTPELEIPVLNAFDSFLIKNELEFESFLREIYPWYYNQYEENSTITPYNDFVLSNDQSFDFEKYDYIFVYNNGSSTIAEALDITSFSEENGNTIIQLTAETNEESDDYQTYFKIIKLTSNQ